MDTLAVIDFETTGLSPGEGARATEIAVIVLEQGRTARHYQSLMNAGVRIPAFITALTGISNDMVRRAPPAAQVMQEVADFVGDLPLVAHNASFDRKFWDAELALIRRERPQEFACSMLVARRIYPEAPNHKLGTLATFARLPETGKAHRALADAEMTAHLLRHMEETLKQRFQIPQLSHALLRALQQAKASNLQPALKPFLRAGDLLNFTVAPATPSEPEFRSPPPSQRSFPHRIGTLFP
ncbi:MAG: 3'-5' exonuclease [Magnetococcales bacterium]|nr:3'-5' exonuclease [Magnetococcales bacterium]